MLPSPSVAIIILNWNNASYTQECLDSVAQLDYRNFDVIVVDNGSTDDSVDKLRGSHPAVQILELKSNTGYAAGNNAGLKFALAQGFDYVLVLNNDTLVAPTMLTKLVRVAETSPDIGMVGPTMYCMGSKDHLFAVGSLVKWDVPILEHRGMFQSTSSYPVPAEVEAVDFIVGCGVLMRRRLIEVAGVYDPAYFLNYEDVEIGIRAWRYGFRVLFVPEAIMWHEVSASLGLNSPAKVYYMTRNSLRFFWTNGPRHRRWINTSKIILRTLRTVSAWTLKPKYRSQDLRRHRSANLFALRDAILGRFGEMGSDVQRICYGGQ